MRDCATVSWNAERDAFLSPGRQTWIANAIVPPVERQPAELGQRGFYKNLQSESRHHQRSGNEVTRLSLMASYRQNHTARSYRHYLY